MRPWLHYFFLTLVVSAPARGEETPPPDLIIHHAKVVTVDAGFRIAEAVAITKGRIQAVGANETILKLKGPKTRLLDAVGKTVLPGLYDSHVHPVDAATSELKAPLPVL